MPAAVKRLKAAARILVWALFTTESTVLATAAQLQVVGQVAVATGQSDQQHPWQGRQVDVGTTAAPTTWGTVMVVQVTFSG